MKDKLQKILLVEKEQKKILSELQSLEEKIISEYKQRAHHDINMLYMELEKEIDADRTLKLEKAKSESDALEVNIVSFLHRLNQAYNQNKDLSVNNIEKEVFKDGSR